MLDQIATGKLLCEISSAKLFMSKFYPTLFYLRFEGILLEVHYGKEGVDLPLHNYMPKCDSTRSAKL